MISFAGEQGVGGVLRAVSDRFGWCGVSCCGERFRATLLSGVSLDIEISSAEEQAARALLRWRGVFCAGERLRATLLETSLAEKQGVRGLLRAVFGRIASCGVFCFGESFRAPLLPGVPCVESPERFKSMSANAGGIGEV